MNDLNGKDNVGLEMLEVTSLTIKFKEVWENIDIQVMIQNISFVKQLKKKKKKKINAT